MRVQGPRSRDTSHSTLRSDVRAPIQVIVVTRWRVIHVTAADRWILGESRRLRLFTLFILYVAQGVPLGLFWFAIPAWMAANGASAADVGYVLEERHEDS